MERRVSHLFLSQVSFTVLDVMAGRALVRCMTTVGSVVVETSVRRSKTAMAKLTEVCELLQ